MTPAPVIDICDLCFSYNVNEVLHNVNARVGAKDMVAIVGPNGGGKTTLLKLILGLLEPTFGSTKLFGEAPGASRHRIGYVPQHLSFDPRFPVSVFDVVVMGRIHRHRVGSYRKADVDAARHALEQVGLINLQKRPFADLSGGERQRVLVAQALVSDPEILFLDEPTANVDAAAKHNLYELFQTLHEQMTIVLVSHNLGVVSRHMTHVLCVNRTADMHPIQEIMSSEFQDANGDELAVILHDVHCHVLDASRVLDSDHAAHHHHGAHE